MNRSLEDGLPHPLVEHAPELPEDVLEDTMEHIPPEVRVQATEHMLDLLRSVLRGVDGYAIFASTGMYLQGKRIGDGEMQVPPGDLDVAVADVATLQEIMERLRKVDGVTFANRITQQPAESGITRPFAGQEAMVLAGSVLMRVGSTDVSYPFEFFVEQRIVDDQVFAKREKVEGLNVLTLEGLKGQYLHNLEFDSRLARSVEEVAAFLGSHEAELQRAMAGGDRSLLDVVVQTYEITEAELQAFFPLYNRISGADGKEREQLQSALSKLLGGIKTKVAKRRRNVQQLQGHLDT